MPKHHFLYQKELALLEERTIVGEAEASTT